jgi:hypothetical protein
MSNSVEPTEQEREKATRIEFRSAISQGGDITDIEILPHDRKKLQEDIAQALADQRAEALEEAAKLVESREWSSTVYRYDIAAAIRSLAEKGRCKEAFGLSR